MIRNRVARYLSFVISIIILLTSSLSSPIQEVHAVAGAPLSNSGFEDGTINSAPRNWSVVSSADAVIVVNSEGPAKYPTYLDMGNVTITPFKGNLMLRLGTPKKSAENQNQGLSKVSQEFTPNSSRLRFSFRLFSWEFRGRDSFGFNLTDATGKSVGKLQPLTLTMADGTAVNFTALPVQTSLSVGKRGQYLDSRWVKVEITDVPTDGRPLTLSYFVGGTNDSAHATWAYFDNVNLPPVAKFNYSPTRLLEGGRVQLQDLSSDPDPGDSIAAWNWTVRGPISGPNAGTVNLNSRLQHPYFIPPDDGEYAVSLTVTDKSGDSATVSSGGTASDGTVVPRLIVGNTPPKLNALSLEIRNGDSAPLLGRFIDHGWLDVHTATWQIEGITTPIPVSIKEDRKAVLGTGIVTAQIQGSALQKALTALGRTTLPAVLNGSLRITDNQGLSGQDGFSITILADNPQNYEAQGNNSLSTLAALNAGRIYSSYIQDRGDIDIFEIRLPGSQSLPAGSDILVTLKGLPADYDLALITRLPAATSVSGQVNSGQPSLQTSEFDMSEFDMSEFDMSEFDMSEFDMSEFDMSEFDMSEFDMSEFDMSPLSGMSFTGLSGNSITGTDIKPAELGLSGILTADSRVVGFSANRGVKDESLITRVAIPGTRVFAVVIGANGVFSVNPYLIQVESSLPHIKAASGVPLVSPATGQTIIRQDNAPATLFVTQMERINAIYHPDMTAFTDKLKSLAAHGAVRGDILSLPSSIFDPWDVRPSSVDEANNVVAQIRSIIQGYITLKPSIQNIVVVGNDDIVPFRRVPDETIISNERFYLLGSRLKPGTPLFASILGGNNLTDDYYADFSPASWQGRELYYPDLPIGRMVETPQEIMAAADAFIRVNGVLSPRTAFVSGYEGFSDGASQIAGNLTAGGLSTSSLISNGWTAADLRSRLLIQTSPDVSSPNAHFTHYAALSASGFTAKQLDTLTSSEVAKAGTASDALFGRLIFSIGCHAGFNAPDRSAMSSDAGLVIDPALDFPQAMAQQRAVYVASTGYGLFDTEGIGGTEKLLAILSKGLTSGDISIGRAMVTAKQRYLGSLAPMTVYDEKSSIQLTLYGLPMYRIVVNSPVAPQVPQPAPGSVVGNITISDGSNLSSSQFSMQPVTSSYGSYFTINGDAQSTPGRAVAPRLVIPLTPDAARGPAHGVLVTGAAYSDISGFDPVIARPTNEWERNVVEPRTSPPSFWPSELASVSSLESFNGPVQSLVILPGQFNPTSLPGQPVRGIQRLYNNLNLTVQRSASSDWQAPTIRGVDLRPGANGSVDIIVDAGDTSGIAKVVVLRISGATITSTILNINPPLPLSGKFTANIPATTQSDKLIIQVVDGAGNVANYSTKGAGFYLVQVDAGPDIAYGVNYPVPLKATINGFTNLIGPVFYTWDFGDGTSQSGTLSSGAGGTTQVTIDASGNATFTTRHTYTTSAPLQLTATIKVTDANGGIGTDDVLVRRVWDPLGDVFSLDADYISGYMTNDNTTMTIGVTVAGQINPEFQYRIKLYAGTSNWLLRYDNGKATGLSSLQATASGNTIRYTFTMAEVGLAPGLYFQWSAHTQAGVPGMPATGMVDDMPDVNAFNMGLL